jgi:hypothetical protein
VSRWHSRLCHPALSVVCHVLSSFKLSFLQNKKEPTFCAACLGSKSHQLPFSKSLHCSKFPLEVMYADVWGPSPIFSKSGFRYYISFLDDFSHYSWFFPIMRKSDVYDIFVKFQSYVDTFLTQKIKCVQSNWGGEYHSLNKYFQQRYSQTILSSYPSAKWGY